VLKTQICVTRPQCVKREVQKNTALCVRVDTERADQSDKYQMEFVLMFVS